MAKTIKTGTFYRSLAFERAAIDEKARTVSLSFASEAPVERYFGNEILDCSPDSVDMTRLRSGAPLLMEHDRGDQIGVVQEASMKDGKGYATVRFGKSTRAQEIFQDVLDGVRSLVSVGYRINKMVTDKVEEGVETMRATRWTPMEISLVSVPADPSVGIGRAESEKQFETLIEEKKNMSTVIETSPAPAPAPNTAALRGEGAAAERARAAEINAIAVRLLNKVPTISDIAKRAIENGETVDAFRAKALELLPEATPVGQPAKPILADVKARDWAKYSLTRAAAMLMSGIRPDGIEKEFSDEIALRTRTQAGGLWIPDEAMGYLSRFDTGPRYNGYEQRNFIAGTNTLGGFLVQTENLAAEFVALLRNRARVLGLGARVLNLSTPVTIPRQNAAGATNWVTETTASTLSTGNFTQFTLTPQAVSAFQQYSKQLLMESNPSIDLLVRDDIIAQIGIAVDLAALHGSGSGQPTGIANTTGIGSVALNSNGLALGNSTAYSAMVSLETLVASANADVATMAYLARAGHRGALKTQPEFTNTGIPVWSGPAGNQMVNGYTAQVTQQIATNLTTGTATTICSVIFFGDWNQLLIASFGSTDLVVDPYSKAENGVVRLLARRWVDIGVRTPASFAVLGGVLTT